MSCVKRKSLLYCLPSQAQRCDRNWLTHQPTTSKKDNAMGIKIHNINGTSSNTCRCGSWKQHWINQSGERWPAYCSVIGCMERASVGAHVQKIRGSQSWYIIPLCTHHNNQFGQDAEVSEYTRFISANKSDTCDKK